MNCISDNQSDSFEYLDMFINLYVHDNSHVTCTFTNQKKIKKEPILIVPGVLGTEMFKGETRLWASVLRMVNPINSDGFMDPMAFSYSLAPSDESVFFGSVIDNPDNLLNYTEGILKELKGQDYIQNQDVFTFPYDWRYGVSEGNVEALAEKIKSIKTQTGSEKVNVVAHSTGGLLLKKYIMDHPTDHYVNKAVMVGVPNLGSPKAIKTLVQGDNFGVVGLSDEEMKKIAENLPVVYDLAPNQKYYDTKGSYVKVIEQKFLARDIKKDLNFQEVGEYLIEDHDLNSLAYQQAKELHTETFTNYDMRSNGVDVYNITGCKTGTLGKIAEKRTKDFWGHELYSFQNPEYVSGDQTVPFESADSVKSDENKKYYAVGYQHGTMMTSNGSRQLIVNLLTGSNLPTGNGIIGREALLQDPGRCEIKGKSIQIMSPLNIEVLDQNGNRLGMADDGSLENAIPGADFNIFGDHKFVFLPEDNSQTYQINLKGTDEGIFTLKVEEVDSGRVTQSENYINLPVSTTTLGSLQIAGFQTELSLDQNGDGQADSFPIPVVIDEKQAGDELAPVSTSTISGALGQPGFYRSDVSINISAQDVADEGVEPSGVFQTFYRVGQGEWSVLTGEPLILSEEGQYQVEFFSVDRAGNQELPQLLEFFIDKTSPEAEMYFDALGKDLIILGKDNLSSVGKVKVEQLEDGTVLVDEAGNTLEIKFAEKNRRRAFKANILELAYNGQVTRVDKNRLKVEWTADKFGNIKKLWQYLESKKDFRVRAVYDGKQTKIISKDFGEKRVEELVPGLNILRFWTDKGEMGWGKGSD
jgi:pimeloyl-ACP methyl ester carboxylesterase